MRNKWLVAILSLILSLMLGCAITACANDEGGNENQDDACEHVWDEGTVTKPATCEEDGVRTFTCQKDSSHTKTEKIDALGHQWDDGVITKSATCTEKGVKTFTCQNDSKHTKTEDIPTTAHKMQKHTGTPATCTAPGTKDYWTCENESENVKYANAEGTETLDDLTLSATGHKMQKHTGTPATCTAPGTKDYWTCENEGEDVKYANAEGTETLDDLTIDALGHDFQNGQCSRCGEKDTSNTPVFSEDGKTVTFGKYPKTKVTEATLNNALNMAGGSTPTATQEGEWQDYGYYHGGEKIKFMWYIDVEYQNETYRGVYFTEWRTFWITYPEDGASAMDKNDPDWSYQISNLYQKNVISWFKWEPITWTVLEKSDSDAFLVADYILDAQNYSTYSRKETKTNINGKEVYDNNYKGSYIRQWLNSVFLETAFTANQQESIKVTDVDNSIATLWSKTGEEFACENTQDKIFLLSFQELDKGLHLDNPLRVRKGSDYAKSQGLQAVYETSEYGSRWWMRSPSNSRGDKAQLVAEEGNTNYLASNSKVFGVVPAMHIKVSS